MADVKVPPMLHKMSVAAQKAWYKKNKMEYPGAAGKEGKSAAQAKKDVGEINKKKAREAAIAAAAASKKNKKLVSSSERVRKMASLAQAFGGERPGGDLTTNRGIVQYVRGGGTLRAGRLGEANNPNRGTLQRYNIIANTAKEVERKRASRSIVDRLKSKGRGIGLDPKKDLKLSPSSSVNVDLSALSHKQISHQYEAAKPDASMTMTDTLKKKMITDKDKQTLGKVADLMRSLRNKDKKNAFVRQKGLEAMKAGKVDPARGHSPTRFGREELRKEEKMVNPGLAKYADDKKEPPFTPDKKPVRRGRGGPMSQAKWLAKQAMMKAMKKEEVDLVSEQDDTMEKKEMAQTQLHFMKYAAEEILEFIKMGGEIEEWYQNKLSKVHSDVEGLHSYVEGEKRRVGMVEEVEQIDEADLEEGYEGKSNHKPGWMLKADPELAKKLKDKTDLAKKRQATYGDPAAGKSVKEALDPVGKEDADIDNDGDSDKTDVYLHRKRKAIGAAIKKKVADKMGK